MYLMNPIEFAGPSAMEPVVNAALSRVIDPEMALNIVDLGLVYAVSVEGNRAHVRLTMTSAACPMNEMIVDDVTHEMHAALGDGCEVAVEVCWDPPWTPERMSAGARAMLGV